MKRIARNSNLLVQSKDKETFPNTRSKVLISTKVTTPSEAKELHNSKSTVRNSERDEYDGTNYPKSLIKPSRSTSSQNQRFRFFVEPISMVHFEALPAWLQDNDFLQSHNRSPMPSFWKCLKSIFLIHSDTGNIWTHIIGCFLFIMVAVNFFFWAPDNMIGQDKLVIQFFIYCVILSFTLSILYHTFNCHSKCVAGIFRKLDFFGIIMLFVGSFLPWIYYAFYCQFLAQVSYSIITFTMAMICILLTLWNKFTSPSFRLIRTLVFFTFGLWGIIPVTHYLIANGYDASIGWLFLMGSIHSLGAVIYAARVPERFLPGKCDICFQSHQIFHTMVIFATLIHYHCLSVLAEDFLNNKTCPDTV